MTRWLFLLFLAGCSTFSLTAQGVCLPDSGYGAADGPGFVVHSSIPLAGTFFSFHPGSPVFTLHFFTKASLMPLYAPSAAKEDFLPKWSPESLPFFCRVEHDWGKKLPFAFKFRLGSVEYVDWLEGKTTWISR